MDLLNSGRPRLHRLIGRRVVLGVALFWIGAALGAASQLRCIGDTAPIEQLYAALQTVMKAGKAAPFRQRYDTLAPVIARTFDLDGILENSVGPLWGALPSDQQLALKDAFRRYDSITSLISTAFPDSTRGSASSVAKPARTRSCRRGSPASGEAHRLDYVMRQVGGAWKIVDVLADGFDQPGGRATLRNANAARKRRRSGAPGSPTKEDGGNVWWTAATLAAHRRSFKGYGFR
jgi:hypothetical protein